MQPMADYDHVLLASEGREFSQRSIDVAAEMADTYVRVFTIARVHGVAFGLPNPGLLPTRAEWQERRNAVAKAVKALKKRGLAADGHVIGTRKATKAIVQEALLNECEAIVMPGDPPKSRVMADFMWTQEAYRVARAARLPVFIVTDDEVIEHTPTAAPRFQLKRPGGHSR